VDGVDDLGVIDSLQMDRGDPKVRVAELALDHDQRHTLARHLNRVRMAQLVWREPAANTGRRSNTA
jgi:hypothetical protein